jgi:hypothetical protein
MKYRGFQIDVIGTNVYVSPDPNYLRFTHSHASNRSASVAGVAIAMNEIDAYLKEFDKETIEPDGRL